MGGSDDVGVGDGCVESSLVGEQRDYLVGLKRVLLGWLTVSVCVSDGVGSVVSATVSVWW